VAVFFLLGGLFSKGKGQGDGQIDERLQTPRMKIRKKATLWRGWWGPLVTALMCRRRSINHGWRERKRVADRLA
jgi:hypothetical protein